MSYRVKAVVRDIKYMYQGYLHEDEEIVMSVWDGDRQVPIGEVAKVAHDAGDEYESQFKALRDRYGQDFADELLGAFAEAWWPARISEVKETEREYCRLSLCCRLTTEEILADLRDKKIEIEDLRSESSRSLSADMRKVWNDDPEIVAEDLAKRETAGPLERSEVVAMIEEKYEVCKEAAEWYVNTYCQYEYKDRSRSL